MVFKNSLQFRIFPGEGIELEKLIILQIINKYKDMISFSKFIKTSYVSFNIILILEKIIELFYNSLPILKKFENGIFFRFTNFVMNFAFLFVLQSKLIRYFVFGLSCYKRAIFCLLANGDSE